MRIGVFGGTFDPVHNAHCFVAESARLLERLDRVLFVPTGNNHYRSKPQADAAHRCAMILGAIESNPAFHLDHTDLREDASGYTADLLPRLHAKYPGASFTFIIGADSLASANWVRLDEVLEALERFAIAPRTGVQADALARVIAAVPPALRERVTTLNLPEIPVVRESGAQSARAGTQRALSRARAGLEVHYRARTLRLSRRWSGA